MIHPGEIQKKAKEAGVRDQQIEKDYVLSWILKGIAEHEKLSKSIVFKGGTVLKKVYFEDYRFSEDLDFTSLDNKTTNTQIFAWFSEAFEHIKEAANIPLEIVDSNDHQDGGLNFFISYIGPLGGQGTHKRVKVDISRGETLEFEPVMQVVFASYSDAEGHQLLCYTLEEILVEKMRSIMQRSQARDFYDIWFLLEQHRMDPSLSLREFSKKCVVKNLNPSDFPEKLAARLPQYKGRWKNSLNDQIKDLPSFEQVERETMRHLKNLKF